MEKGPHEEHDHDTRLEVDVAVIGNGPAGIALSFMLSGHWPYFTGNHPHPYLASKLKQAPQTSLLQQDLEELSDGLEGRSNNPVSVLFDTLMRPNTDIGEDHAPSLTWTHDPLKAVPHVVIGNGKPGGSWHHMQPDLETVSLGHWLELPGYPFNQWKTEQEQNRNQTGDIETAAVNGTGIKRKRALLGEVAQYYVDYVAKMGLEEYFLNGVEVVGAVDVRKSKVNNKPSVLESRCSSGSRLSSLSSSPGLYSPSHVTSDVPSAELLRSLQEDVGYQRLADGDFEEQLLAAAARGGGNIFRVDSETSVGEVIDHIPVSVSQQSEEDAKTPGHMSPVRCTEICDGNQKSDSVPFQIQPFTTDSELQQMIECFPETNCCCLSDPDDSGVFCLEAKKLKPEYRWCIRGRQASSQDVDRSHDRGKCIKILAKKLVLACGVGQHRKLGVPGEDLPFIHHQYSDLVPAVGDNSLCDPILVVGAGLSAADAVLLALKRGVRVVHAFYQDASDPSLIYHKMPPNIYQEYRRVFTLMQGKTTNDNYTPLPKHKVMEFKEDGTCRLRKTDGESERELKISSCHVLIGSEADLKFLPQRLTSTLGVKADAPIHPKLNPVDIHPYSFQSESVPSLYAVGPLVGDNFVRFVLGGALGIAHHILVNNNRSKDV